ncbi:hypothetical protein N7486_002279 [Penicillium sp. IBT 16267x]|nr:hypothetical protein N7486_002279 [Penicillium sp. IBT 16267x]
MIKKLGANFEEYDMRVENCTHLITTEKHARKLNMPAKIKDAGLKGCEIITLEWLLASIECGYPIETKDYKLETTKIAKLGLKGKDKASSKLEASGSKPSLKEADKARPRLKEADKPKPLKETDKPKPLKEADKARPRLKEADKPKPLKETDKPKPLKEADEPNARLKETDKVKSKLKETDKAKPKLKDVDKLRLKPKKANKPKSESKGTGEAKRALEDPEDDGNGAKKVAKTSSDVNYLHCLHSIVDEGFPDLPKGLTVWTQGDDVWDATLMKPLAQKTGDGNRQFVVLRIQLRGDANKNQYHTFSHEKNGEVIVRVQKPETGYHTFKHAREGELIAKTHRSGLGSLEEAKAAFQERFQDATGHPWESRLEDPKKNKFIYVEHHLKDEETSQSALAITKTLPPTVKAVLGTILSYTNEANLIKRFLKNKPAGPIMNGRDVFSKTAPSLDWIQREQDHLSYLHILATASQSTQPPGWVEEQLSQHLHRIIGLNHMAPVDSSTEEYRILANYFNFSDMRSAYGGGYGGYYGYTNQLKNIFRIERLGEADRFLTWTKAEKAHGRILLWHGSSTSSFEGIFEKGLIGGIEESEIFLSDLAGYSTLYCSKLTGPTVGVTKLMLLCEVSSPEFSKGLTDGDSWCDAGCVHADLQGVKMLNVPPGGKYSRGGGWPIGLEYSFPNPKQIRMRYLFEFEIGFGTSTK